jgi:Mg2+-importing ATPase
MKLTLKEFSQASCARATSPGTSAVWRCWNRSTDTTVSREVPPTLANTLVDAAHRDSGELLSSLGTHTDGLTDFEADALRAQYGLNEVEHEQPLPWWTHLWHCYKNPFNLLLTLLAVISWLTEDMKAATVIFSMVVLSTLLRFWQESKSNQAADALKAMVSNTATVMRRDEPRIELPIKQLVPGDLIVLSAGDMIPADCRVLSAKDLFVSQAAMTGESMPVEKFARQPTATRATRWSWTTFCSWAPTWCPARRWR